MFTGIVKHLGRVDSLERGTGGTRLTVHPSEPLEGLEVGESIAVEGVCLTAEPGSSDEKITFFLAEETLSKTTLGKLETGAAVNLERSLTASDRMGGHIVMGHVDGVGRIRSLEQNGEGWELEIESPEPMAPFLAPKGSVSVDGISLTVIDVLPGGFTVTIIPHTYEATSLHTKSQGSPVNLEADMIARYVARYLSASSGDGSISEDLLKQAGFL